MSLHPHQIPPPYLIFIIFILTPIIITIFISFIFDPHIEIDGVLLIIFISTFKPLINEFSILF